VNNIITERVERMRGKKFNIGEFDCANMVIQFLSDFVEVPTEFEDVTIDTYRLLYKNNPNRALKVMVRWLESFLTEIDYKNILPGDIVVLSYNFLPIFLGIVLGNGRVAVVDQRNGIVSTFLGLYKMERIFRCQQLYRTLRQQH